MRVVGQAMTLLELQQRFSLLVAELIGHAYSLGYAVTFGETWRPPELAMLYARQGKGIIKSLHCDRLAVDLNLFKGAKYLDKSEDYKQLGDYWKQLGTDEVRTCWGGDFPKLHDGNHFSVEYHGRK